MSVVEALVRNDASGLARLVREGEFSATELLEAAIGRAEAVNSRLNAIITPMYDLALEAVRDGVGDGPFAGVPFLLKDIRAAYKGVPRSAGCKALRDVEPDFDSELVARYKRVGLVVFGKTNTPEFGLTATTARRRCPLPDVLA